MNEQELNKKLAEWAGLKLLPASISGKHWFDSKGNPLSPTDKEGNPIFTEDLTCCLKHLLPELGIVSLHFSWGNGGCTCWFYTKAMIGRKWEAMAETLALALCLAIEKLIDEEAQNV